MNRLMVFMVLSVPFIGYFCFSVFSNFFITQIIPNERFLTTYPTLISISILFILEKIKRKYHLFFLGYTLLLLIYWFNPVYQYFFKNSFALVLLWFWPTLSLLLFIVGNMLTKHYFNIRIELITFLTFNSKQGGLIDLLFYLIWLSSMLLTLYIVILNK